MNSRLLWRFSSAVVSQQTLPASAWQYGVCSRPLWHACKYSGKRDRRSLCAGGADWQRSIPWLNPFNIPRSLSAQKMRTIFFIWNRPENCESAYRHEDGSLGFQGFVTNYWIVICSTISRNTADFFNCGPQAMIAAAVELEQRYTSSEIYYSAVDYVTTCGVGLCGSCAAPDGRRLCVDGPFLRSVINIGSPDSMKLLHDFANKYTFMNEDFKSLQDF